MGCGAAIRLFVARLFLFSVVFVFGVGVGEYAARVDIAQAILAGRLSVLQRLETLAAEIQSREYVPIGH